MHEVIDDKLDLVTLIIVLALVVTTGFTININTYRKAIIQQQEMLEDKNTENLSGYKFTESDFDNKYSLYEMMLLIQSQDYSMPEPREVRLMTKDNTVYGTVFMENNYRETLVDTSNTMKIYAQTAATALGKSVNNLKYTMGYKNDITYNADGSIASMHEYFAIMCE